MKNLTLKQRFFIEKSLKNKMSVKDIADTLGYTRQAIYLEIKMGTVIQKDSLLREYSVYLSDYAQRIHDERAKHKGCKAKLSSDDSFLDLARYYIMDLRYSPEMFLMSIPKECRKVCKATLYSYIRKGLLSGVQLLYPRHLKKKKVTVAKSYPKGTPIEERPIEANERSEYGHWEMDTVYSSRDDKSCLLTMTERKVREEICIKMKDRTAFSVLHAFNEMEKSMGTVNFRKKFKTITCDNGVEFSSWELLEKCRRSNQKRTKIYFCNPYHSWERGSNENYNRLIRRWIPKGDDIGLYTKEEIKKIQDWINNYPVKLFDFKSSNQLKISPKIID